MVISSKGRYALRVMVYLAVNHSDDYLKDEQNTCERSSACYTLPIWEGLAKLINDYFDNMTLEDVAKVAIREQNDVTEAVSK